MSDALFWFVTAGAVVGWLAAFAGWTLAIFLARIEAERQEREKPPQPRAPNGRFAARSQILDDGWRN